MQGTCTRARSRTTPPWQRRLYVAPAGHPRFRAPLLHLRVTHSARERADFRAGSSQREPYSTSGAEST